MTASTGTDERELPPLPNAAECTMPCEDCEGHGIVGEAMPQGEFQPPEYEHCSSCNGTGKWVAQAFTADQMREYILADRASLGAAQVPAGWKLVPIEPTEDMRQAGAQFAECGISANAVFGYRAMLATAPEPPAGAAQVPSLSEITDEFRGDNDKLVECIGSLLRLDAKGALVPHGIGGFARDLLSAAAVRIAALSQPSQQGTKS